MSRVKQPREAAELKGANRVHPERYRGEVPKSKDSLGDPPDRLSDAARKAWTEIEAYAIPGVLTSSDRFFMEFAANLLAEYWRSPDDFQTSRFGQMISVFARLGMSPADRQKLAVEKAEDENPYTRLDS
jgi:hypothetical protein